jgi:glycosyltransferase involved in cell wall biosynthesis
MTKFLIFLTKIDIVFESARFYGWRFPLPILTWIPDFQHRHLKKLFSWKAFWKREIGFRLQALSGRHVLLSSNDAKYDCEKFYPSTRGHTTAVNFCVPSSSLPSIEEVQKIIDIYGLPRHFFFLPNQFWAHKNHICVINALSKLKERGICPVIVCSGKQADERDPNYFKRIQNLICANGLGDNLKLLGVIPRDHISALMMKCAALINPSTFEGWSTTVEEAKAIGAPMILSRIRVHQEQNSDAFFFDPHSSDQLSNILENFIPLSPEERESRRREAAGIAVSNFQKFSNEFANLIERQFQTQRSL